MTPQEQDEAQEAKKKANKEYKQIQADAATAKKDADLKAAEAHAAKLQKDSTITVKSDEAKIVVDKEAKAKKVAEEKPKAEDLKQPWGTEGEVWTANMPSHHLEGYAQTSRKDVKEHEFVENNNEEEEEEESEEEDSGDESDE